MLLVGTPGRDSIINNTSNSGAVYLFEGSSPDNSGEEWQKKLKILSSKDATFEVKSPCGSPTGTNLNDQADKDIELVKANGDPLDTNTKYNCNIEVTSDDGDVVVKTIPEFSIYDVLDLNNYDEFATDIAINDSYAAFGTPGRDSIINNTSNSGAVYLFEKPDQQCLVEQPFHIHHYYLKIQFFFATPPHCYQVFQRDIQHHYY